MTLSEFIIATAALVCVWAMVFVAAVNSMSRRQRALDNVSDPK